MAIGSVFNRWFHHGSSGAPSSGNSGSSDDGSPMIVDGVGHDDSSKYRVGEPFLIRRQLVNTQFNGHDAVQDATTGSYLVYRKADGAPWGFVGKVTNANNADMVAHYGDFNDTSGDQNIQGDEVHSVSDYESGTQYTNFSDGGSVRFNIRSMSTTLDPDGNAHMDALCVPTQVNPG